MKTVAKDGSGRDGTRPGGNWWRMRCTTGLEEEFEMIFFLKKYRTTLEKHTCAHRAGFKDMANMMN